MRQELWIDADDTLWENNVFFERVFERFVDFLDHRTLNGVEVRAVLDQIEHANNKVYGYGAANFTRNLRQCFERLAGRKAAVGELALFEQFREELENHPIELLDGVEETLAYLSGRHGLVLCSKGNAAEQRRKIERSGLAGHFDEVRIVREKDAASYRALAAERGVDPARSWMVGNSPKSDINPALAAGLGAVFIPHPRTWHLEHEAVPERHERLLVLERFGQLREYF